MDLCKYKRHIIHGIAGANLRSQGETIEKQNYFLGQGFMEESTYRRSNLGAGRGDAEELSTFISRYVEFRERKFLKEGRM